MKSGADRIISICQPHLRPIVSGKAKATVEFGAKTGAGMEAVLPTPQGCMNQK